MYDEICYDAWIRWNIIMMRDKMWDERWNMKDRCKINVKSVLNQCNKNLMMIDARWDILWHMIRWDIFMVHDMTNETRYIYLVHNNMKDDIFSWFFSIIISFCHHNETIAMHDTKKWFHTTMKWFHTTKWNDFITMKELPCTNMRWWEIAMMIKFGTHFYFATPTPSIG